jgi:hypothetical protein
VPLASRRVTIILRRTGDLTQDTRRARSAYNLLQSHPGGDRFAFIVVDDTRRVMIDFPGSSIGYTPDLAQSLEEVLGQDAIQVI